MKEYLELLTHITVKNNERHQKCLNGTSGVHPMNSKNCNESDDRVGTNDEFHNNIMQTPIRPGRFTRPTIRDISCEGIKKHYIGKMTISCTHCNAIHFEVERVAQKNDSFNDCCSHGEVALNPLPEPPELLSDLFNGNHEQSKQFLEHDLDQNDSPSHGQLFIVDQNESTDIRCQQISTLDTDIVSYRMMHEEVQSAMENNHMEREPEMQLLFSLKHGMDPRRYNSQRINEVAAVFKTTADGDIPESYVSIRNRHTKTLQFINSLDPNVQPWIYPLLYPYGTQGWSPNIPCVKRARRVSRTEANHKTLRADTYQGLLDHLQRSANERQTTLGKVIILPSSFTGSPRNMLQHYQHAMAIVRQYGKPDLFITTTCNPNWLEIQENLLPGQTASDRPDIVSRVFHLKKEQLMEVILKEKLFGDVIAHVNVTEYQKRGLPHVHLLLTLKENCKITTPDVIDKYISAEIPDPEGDTILHDAVMKQMIHGPCGNWYGYPAYQRRNTGSYDRANGSSTNNQYVVPYNSKLLKLFGCHINVEVVTSIKSVKYLYKYIYKGHDAACITIRDPETNEKLIAHDEIKNFVDARYNQQNVIINDDADENDMRSALHRTNMLLDYFALNEHDSNALQFTYFEIPSHYVFKKQSDSNVSKWMKRQSHFNVIGRMYSINVKGATSYESLRTVHGQTYPTFQDTCLALGLIEDDAEWERALPEGEVWMMPRQLRNLFVRFLIYCQPNNPRELWQKFKDAMAQDLQRQLSVPEAERRIYVEVNHLLSVEGSGISRFPTMRQMTDLENNIDVFIENEISLEEHRDIGQNRSGKWNSKQKDMVDNVLNAVETTGSPTKYFYIDGPRGSGKPFAYTTLYHLLRTQEKKVHTMAFIGIAAILLPRGKTVHQSFGMPVPIFNDSVSNFRSQSSKAQYLREVDVFIWDEAKMAPRYALELVDRSLRDFMKNDLPFGGKIMILGGDFRQLLPVKPHATRSKLVNLSIKFSLLWKQFTIFSLTENMRALSHEIELAKCLLSVGDGNLNDDNNNLIAPEQCVAQTSADIIHIFTNIINEPRYGDFAKVAILSARDIDVDEINDRVIDLLDRKTQKIYTGIDSVENCDNGDISHDILPEYLHTLSPPNFPPYELKLRINCVVMLIRNMSVNEGLCNGTRLHVLELANNPLRCQILTGDKAGEIVFIHRVTLYCENIYPFIFKRRQFPLRPAFAMTINKSQGQTFKNIHIDLRKDVFNHGQLYVAFSRV
ncbi:uncharacterized protein LOC135169788 [Diachasmimorpha longicaudata]|uniref:uncharacterized protein LOC135169788 n=1 Tax=Diachasmimorpha longicaudata TaxID=58733 RepID=UPI0030B8A545